MAVQMTKNFAPQPHETGMLDGMYKIRLTQIGEPKLYPGFQGGPEVEKARFGFRVMKDYQADEHEDVDLIDQEVSALVNINATGEKSTLYKIVMALTGKKPEELGDFDLYELYDSECKATIKVKYSEDGKNSYANIIEFLPLKPIKTADAPAPAPINFKKPAPATADTRSKAAAAKSDLFDE